MAEVNNEAGHETLTEWPSSASEKNMHVITYGSMKTTILSFNLIR